MLWTCQQEVYRSAQYALHKFPCIYWKCAICVSYRIVQDVKKSSTSQTEGLTNAPPSRRPKATSIRMLSTGGRLLSRPFFSWAFLVGLAIKRPRCHAVPWRAIPMVCQTCLSRVYHFQDRVLLDRFFWLVVVEIGSCGKIKTKQIKTK